MLINLRNALMAGKRLPYDAESEYLESDGNAYAVVPNNIFSKHTGLRVELTLSTGSATLSAVSVLLAAGGVIQGPPYYYRVAIDKTVQFASPGIQWFSLFTDGNVHTVSTTNVNLTNTAIYTNTDIDGTRVLSGSYSYANKTFDDTVGIFAFNNGNNKCPAGIRIYSIVAFDENGNKTADYIPVRKGTVGYLYDRVSGKLFGNAGTGDFQYGRDVVPITWADNERYLNNGVVEAFTGLSRIDNYIPVVGGHSITWKWGDRIIGQAYLIVYNANKQVIDFWSPNNASGERTLNINATAAYARYSVDSAFKETTFFKDNTTGEYAVRNGMVVV